jgi:hypothetical protein
MESQVEIEKLFHIVEIELQTISYKKCQKVFETGSFSGFFAKEPHAGFRMPVLRTTPTPLSTDRLIFFHNSNYNFQGFSWGNLEPKKPWFGLWRISAVHWIELAALCDKPALQGSKRATFLWSSFSLSPPGPGPKDMSFTKHFSTIEFEYHFGNNQNWSKVHTR